MYWWCIIINEINKLVGYDDTLFIAFKRPINSCTVNMIS